MPSLKKPCDWNNGRKAGPQIAWPCAMQEIISDNLQDPACWIAPRSPLGASTACRATMLYEYN